MKTFANLLPPTYKDEVKQWIRDDIPAFDVAGFVVGDKLENAALLCKCDAVLAGVPFVQGMANFYV